jgi:hypothetical protein
MQGVVRGLWAAAMGDVSITFTKFSLMTDVLEF